MCKTQADLLKLQGGTGKHVDGDVNRPLAQRPFQALVQLTDAVPNGSDGSLHVLPGFHAAASRFFQLAGVQAPEGGFTPLAEYDDVCDPDLWVAVRRMPPNWAKIHERLPASGAAQARGREGVTRALRKLAAEVCRSEAPPLDSQMMIALICYSRVRAPCRDSSATRRPWARPSPCAPATTCCGTRGCRTRRASPTPFRALRRRGRCALPRLRLPRSRPISPDLARSRLISPDFARSRPTSPRQVLYCAFMLARDNDTVSAEQRACRKTGLHMSWAPSSQARLLSAISLPLTAAHAASPHLRRPPAAAPATRRTPQLPSPPPSVAEV